MTKAHERIVFPLDVPDLVSAREWIAKLRGEVGVFKVGLELFTAEGPAAVRAVHEAGAQCFLDLKLHDIPATMASAVRSAVRFGVEYLTVHALSGPLALRVCTDASAGSSTRLLAVTVLTSMDGPQLAAIGLPTSAETVVGDLARVVASAGILGAVCSPHEVGIVRSILGQDAVLAVPGVRPVGTDRGDQARVATPRATLLAGADLLVIGRPIRNAPDPVAAVRAIARELAA